LWLVQDDRGAWALPGFVSDEQHTAEVELIARHRVSAWASAS
jgi:hypothetical protein